MKVCAAAGFFLPAFFLFAGGCATTVGTDGSAEESIAVEEETLLQFYTSEYESQEGLSAVFTIEAYNAGAHGTDVLVSVIDSGIDLENPEFEGRIDERSADLLTGEVVGPLYARSGGPSLQDENGHGTAVAGIIGASRNEEGIHGVAPEAALLVFRVDDGEGVFNGTAVREAVSRSVDYNAQVVNMSFGSDGMYQDDAFKEIFTALDSNNIVSVIAAGNQGKDEPDNSAKGAALAVGPDGSTSAIIAGAYNCETGDIAAGSNRAGDVAGDIFLLAPGDLVLSTDLHGIYSAYDYFSGTSVAAPHISGAAALLAGLWPQLTSSQIAGILLESATDLGEQGVDPVYGRGLLNIGAAVSPAGELVIAGEDGTALPVTGFMADLSGAFGEGAFEDIGGVVVFDAYNRHFTMNIDNAVRHRGPGRMNPALLTGSSGVMRASAVDMLSGNIRTYMQLSTQDLSLQTAENHMAAPYSGDGSRHAFMKDRLSFMLEADAGNGRMLSVSGGLSVRSADYRNEDLRHTPLVSPGFFTDPYIPSAPDGISFMLKGPLAGSVQADIFAAYSYGARHSGAYEGAFTHDEKSAGLYDRDAVLVRAGFFRETDSLKLRLEQGFLYERGSIMGAVFPSRAMASTYYGSIDARWAFRPGWLLRGKYATGITLPGKDGPGGLIDGLSGLRSDQFSVSISRTGIFSGNDGLRAGISQPLQIREGRAVLRLPVLYDPFADLMTYSHMESDLSAKGRHLDIEAGYSFPVSRLVLVSLDLVYQHFSGENHSPEALFAFRTRKYF